MPVESSLAQFGVILIDSLTPRNKCDEPPVPLILSAERLQVHQQVLPTMVSKHKQSHVTTSCQSKLTCAVACGWRRIKGILSIR